MAVWKKVILGIIIIYIIISLILNYLVKTNRIKSGKFLRLFVQSDEEFIDYWEKTNKEGIAKYVINNFKFYIIYFFILGIFYRINNINILGFDHKYAIFVVFTVGTILGILSTFIGWNTSKDRYNILIMKRKNDNKIDE